MKKLFSILLSLGLLFTLAVFVQADAPSPAYRFALSVDGQNQKEVRTGDIITVVLYLHRTDTDEAYPMYAMQDEIRYDSNFFELIPDGTILAPDIQSTDIATRENYREFYMNYLSFRGGEQWEAKKMIGSFQLRVIGTSGVTKITNEDYLVSFQDGSGCYPCEANELTVIISTDCTIGFETNGGTKLEPITAVYGETITIPDAPQREGKTFVGWFKDIDCTQEWDFNKDVVSSNMTLYAKWADALPDNTMTEKPSEESDFNFLWLLTLIPIVLVIYPIILISTNQKNRKHNKRRMNSHKK